MAQMQNVRLTATQNEFLDKIKNIYENAVGHETYGDTTEFYDEDGVVLMTATQRADGQVVFDFGENNQFNFASDDPDIQIDDDEE